MKLRISKRTLPSGSEAEPNCAPWPNPIETAIRHGGLRASQAVSITSVNHVCRFPRSYGIVRSGAALAASTSSRISILFQPYSCVYRLRRLWGLSSFSDRLPLLLASSALASPVSTSSWMNSAPKAPDVQGESPVAVNGRRQKGSEHIRHRLRLSLAAWLWVGADHSAGVRAKRPCQNPRAIRPWRAQSFAGGFNRIRESRMSFPG